MTSPHPKTLEQILKDRTPNYKKGPTNYAVLFSGGFKPIYEENLSLAYKTALLNKYRVEDIFIFDGTGKKSPHYPVVDVASKESLSMILQFLSREICQDDVLFLYVTGHGNRVIIQNDGNKKEELSTIETPWEDITELDLEEYLQDIDPRTGILFYDQCYGGGFAQRTGKRNCVAISASEAHKPSYSNTFPQAFFEICAAYESDVSVGLAFKLAKKRDLVTKVRQQYPQILSELNPRTVFLNYNT